MGQKQDMCRISLRKPEGLGMPRRGLEDNVLFTWIVKKLNDGKWTGLSWLGIRL